MDTTGRHARWGVTGNRFSQRRSELLTLAAQRTARLQWTPQLIALLLEALYVDDDFFALLGGHRIPKRRYPQAVALALLMRHAWRTDDFADTAARLWAPSRPLAIAATTPATSQAESTCAHHRRYGLVRIPLDVATRRSSGTCSGRRRCAA
jgi:hypothetical protein